MVVSSIGEMVMEEESCGSSWAREQEKAFENALATHPEDCSDRWEKIAADVPGKTIEDVKSHYELLVEDVNGIESGRVPLPCYPSSSDGGEQANDGGSGKKGGHSRGDPSHSGKASRSEQERRKGMAWTEDEHRLFLLGLDKYGKGDWRSISRNFVISRTPTQVASHAQKYFIRLNSMNKERRRTSIHDITSVGNGDVSTPQGPITGHVSGSVSSTGKSIKQQSPQPSGVPPGVNMYGTTIGQPVAGPLISAVGTPVNLPVPGAPHMAYGVRAPVTGAVVPGAPVNIPPVAHSMPPTSSNR